MNIDIFNRLLCKKVEYDTEYKKECELSLFIIQPKYNYLSDGNNEIKYNNNNNSFNKNSPPICTCYSLLFINELCYDFYQYMWNK